MKRHTKKKSNRHTSIFKTGGTNLGQKEERVKSERHTHDAIHIYPRHTHSCDFHTPGHYSRHTAVHVLTHTVHSNEKNGKFISSQEQVVRKH